MVGETSLDIICLAKVMDIIVNQISALDPKLLCTFLQLYVAGGV